MQRVCISAALKKVVMNYNISSICVDLYLCSYSMLYFFLSLDNMCDCN
jgi:hypothetical protein